MKRFHRQITTCCSVALVTLALAGMATAQAQPPLDIALSHLNANATALGLTTEDVADKLLKNQYRSSNNGITHIHFRQRSQGIEVANGHINVNVTSDGRVLHVGNRFVGNLTGKINTRRPRLDAETAIRQAAEQLGLEIPETLFETASIGGPAREARFSGAGLSQDEIPVKLAFYALDSGDVRLAWEMTIRQADNRHWWNLWVDTENGQILARNDWVAHDQYEVFALPKESPNDGGRTIEVNPAESTASPFGWHDTNGAAGAEFTTTRGNNVCAQEDRDGNNTSCGGVTQPDGGGSLDFTSAVVPLNFADEPDQYVDAAVVNLFYWNNIMHDLLYQYGFDEASGNFQENNYGRGGLASDSVNADAQDNAGSIRPSSDNANMATPPEPNGPFTTNPRMQMYVWRAPAEVEVNPPSTAAGIYGAPQASFGAFLDGTGVTGDVEMASPADACSSLSGFTPGRIAMIDRGNCEFGTKVLNAENAGAIAAIVANNQGGTETFAMGPGVDGELVTIPSVMVSQNDGNTIKAALGAGLNATLRSTQPNRDSDFDAGVIAHEYCHGLSTRLTGGPSTNCLGGDQQAGEGWSDLCTLFFTPDAADTETTLRGVGSYLIFDNTPGAGIRAYPYTTDMVDNPLTYGDIQTAGQPGDPLSIPHGVGTVWATAVWEVYWNLVNDQGFDADLYNGTGGNNVAIQLVVDGLKLQGCNPTFLDARDAILAADQANNGGANECLIWDGFAKRGMGFSADDGGSSSSLAVTEAFDLPSQCTTGCGNGVCDPGESCDGTGGTIACPSDCPSQAPGPICGNGVCEPGEDCTAGSCPSDCNGQQNGNPNNRYCCSGDGTGSGSNMVDCSDSRCTGQGNTCSSTPVPGFCCGDLSCDAGEDSCSCELDCGAPALSEIPNLTCQDSLDNDCDQATDCDDDDCDGIDPACQGCVPTHAKEKGPRCSDGLDNDCDGLIDGADPDC